jgi:UDP-arabinose 4-epimerase
MKRILVTGGAGFVGSHTCKALARAGYFPITFDSLERGHDWAVKWGPLERGDLREEGDLRKVFEAWRPWAVMHFAAYAYIGESTIEPIKYYDTNIGGTAKLLKACAAFECKNIVFSSSCATYGIPARLPLTESDAQQPINVWLYQGRCGANAARRGGCPRNPARSASLLQCRRGGPRRGVRGITRA